MEAEPPRVLSICLGKEPRSLFLYGEEAGAAQSIFEAIYDGPVDTPDYVSRPVILEKIPSLSDGDARLEPVTVHPGDLIIDNSGNWANLSEGVIYRPSGCAAPGCAQTYSGMEAVSIDRLILRFKLLPGMKWSDGAPLTADDSVYSFEIAKSLFPAYRPDLINLTQSYQAMDETTVEWVGPPGYQGARFSTIFFTPLPRHAWSILAPDELATAPLSSQTPLGWGPYAIDEWVPGDHLSLHKNTHYFRAAEGLPAYDRLVFRFVSGAAEALEALRAGECDLVDENAQLDTLADQVFQLQETGQISVTVQSGAAWEQAVFGITPIDEERPGLFAQKEIRQAVAQCIDRQKMATELFGGRSTVADGYLPPTHPLYNPEARRYEFDPAKAVQALAAAGWVDADGDPATPLVAQGAAGVSPGTPFEFTFLTTEDEEKQLAAQILSDSLAQCGIQAHVETMPFADLLAAGPEGPIFGRKFDLAQFGWLATLEPPCNLFQSDEIPGPYPAYPKGWGGANAAGFSSPEYDRACRQAATTLPGSPEYLQAVAEAQAIFAEELPALPLYYRIRLVATRPDMCGVLASDPLENALWNLEQFNYGESCP